MRTMDASLEQLPVNVDRSKCLAATSPQKRDREDQETEVSPPKVAKLEEPAAAPSTTTDGSDSAPSGSAEAGASEEKEQPALVDEEAGASEEKEQPALVDEEAGASEEKEQPAPGSDE
jgi:hypothetical protein